MGTEPCIVPLDYDRHSGEFVTVRATDAELAERLRLSALDFPLERLRLLPRARAADLWPSPATPVLSYLLHLPFSGSSLLSAHLNHAGFRVLRDPALLDALFQDEAAVQGRCPTDLAALRGIALGGFAARSRDRPAFIRTAGYHPTMAARLLSNPGTRGAVFLYCDWRDLVCQILKDARRQTDILHLGRTRKARLAGHTPRDAAEAAAWFWLSYMRAMTVAAVPNPFWTLDAETLFAAPDRAAAAIARRHGIDPPLAAKVDALARSHAKTGAPYDEARRRADREANRARFADVLARLKEPMGAEGAEALVAQINEVAPP